MSENTEDLGTPVSYLVLKEGVPVYDRSGDSVGTVEHVLADEREDVFHGLLLKTADGHRFAGGDQVDGLFERGVIVSEPVGNLAEPSADAPAGLAESRVTALRKAWDWLIQPK
ncbi:PRC-barrel domain-containing protein [Actinoplanes sp. NPDC023714]|uniref:PRC-barrel domain-containing protein n=1 Tax=Actinoplanes sp. NPDC023714 TaxID=3154322 RepID=UPI00340DBC62